MKFKLLFGLLLVLAASLICRQAAAKAPTHFDTSSRATV